jgi:hypothetical protein
MSIEPIIVTLVTIGDYSAIRIPPRNLYDERVLGFEPDPCEPGSEAKIDTPRKEYRQDTSGPNRSYRAKNL